MTVKRPLLVSCFQCRKDFLIKYVIGKEGYSKKNDWDYWTEKEENRGKKICNNCLVSLYKDRKYDYYELIDSTKKKSLFRVYLATGKFSDY